jgi:cell wall-associated NlpC family hydrolase
MTPSNSPQRRLWPRRRILAGVAGVLAVAASLGTSASSASAAAIGGDHHSAVVVQRAEVALAAHDAFSVTGTPGAFVAYLGARDAAADAVAWEMRLDPVAVRAAWAKADSQHQEAVLAALSQLGKPYRHATSDPDVGFDCSGLTAFAWSRAGLEIAHQSGSQISAAARRDQATAVAGDLMQYPGHVMLYLGVGDAIVHASNPSTDVELSFNSRSVKYGNPEG